MPRKRRVVTPFEQHVKDEIKALDKTAKMDRELSKYGRRVSGGMMWTVGDMARFFDAQRKKGKMRY